MIKRLGKVVFLLLTVNMAFGQTNTWLGGVNNDWHNDCNWSLSTIPTAAHTVVIPTSATYPSITGNAHCRLLNITSTALNAVTVNSSGAGNLCISSTNGGACATVLTNNTTYLPANNTTSTAAICENQTKALTGSPAGGTWTIVSGGGSITGSTYTPPNVGANTPVTVRYTIAASGSCGATTSDRTFTVNVLNVANNTTTTTAIDDNQTKALTGTPGGGTWNIISGGGSIAGTTYTPPDVSSPTSVTIRYTIAANGGCAPTTSDVTFTVNDAVVPGSAWGGNGQSLLYRPGGYPCTPTSAASHSRILTNNTGFDITVTMPSISCSNRSGGSSFVIPAGGTYGLVISQPNTGCCINGGDGTITCSWTSTDGASGTFDVEIVTTF